MPRTKIEDGQCSVSRAIIPYLGAYFAIFLSSWLLLYIGYITTPTYNAMTQSLIFSSIMIVPLAFFSPEWEMVDYFTAIPVTWFFSLVSWFMVYIVSYTIDIPTLFYDFIVKFNVGYALSVIVFFVWRPIYDMLKVSWAGKEFRGATIHLIASLIATLVGLLVGGALSQILSI